MTAAERGAYLGQGRPGADGRCRPWWQAWDGLYEGTLLADDIEQLARDLAKPTSGESRCRAPMTARQPRSRRAALRRLQQALERARKEMNGGGIWRNPGPGANPYELLVKPKHAAIAEWKARTLAVLQAPRARSRRAAHAGAGERAAARALDLRPARVPARHVVAVPARGAVGRHRPASRGARAGLPRRLGLDERRDAADRRAARPAVALDPPAVLGVQHGGGAGGDRARRAQGRHVGRHQPRVRARARREDAARLRRDRHGRLHRDDPEAAGRRAREARGCTPSSRATAIRRCSRPRGSLTRSSGGCRNDQGQRSGVAGPPGQAVRFRGGEHRAGGARRGRARRTRRSRPPSGATSCGCRAGMRRGARRSTSSGSRWRRSIRSRGP